MHLPSRYCSLLLWSLRLPKPFLHYIHFNLPFEGLFFAMEFSTLLETVRFLTDKLSGHFYFMCRMKILTLNFNWSLNFSASLRKARIHFRCLRDWWECCFLEICSSSQPEPDCYWYHSWKAPEALSVSPLASELEHSTYPPLYSDLVWTLFYNYFLFRMSIGSLDYTYPSSISFHTKALNSPIRN